MRIVAWLAAVVAAVALEVGAASAAAPLALSPTGNAAYPQKSYILTLAEPRPIAASDLHVTENGVRVGQLTVSRQGTGTSRSAVVLLLDESLTMKGAPIADALAAARAFAAKANPNEQIAVIGFNGSVRVIQNFTTDASAIDRSLAKSPELAYGTRNYDALELARTMLASTGTPGSIIILTDGQTVKNVSSPRAVVRHLVSSSVRVFSVGLESPAFRPAGLEQLAARTGGSYVTATGPKELGPILSELGRRLSNEYVVTYRSVADPGGPVAVHLAVKGVAGAANTVYVAPPLDLGSASLQPRSTLDNVVQSTYTMVLVAFAFAILLGYGAARIVARPQEALVDRVAGFVSIQRPEHQAAAAVVVPRGIGGPGLLQRLAAARPSTRMERLAAALELADVRLEPRQLIFVSTIGTLLVALILFGAIGAIGFVIALVGGPLIVRFIIRRRIAKKRKAFAEQLPDNLEVMSSALRAGHSMIGALQVVADDAAEPSASEFKRVLAEEQFGVQLEDAFKVAVDRMQSEDLDQVALVSRLQREMGSNSAEVLDQVIVTVRGKMEIRRTIGTLTAQGRMSRWLLTLLPVVLALMMTLISPTYMHPLYHKALGEVLLVVAALMVACGSWIIGKIVDIAI